MFPQKLEQKIGLLSRQNGLCRSQQPVRKRKSSLTKLSIYRCTAGATHSTFFVILIIITMMMVVVVDPFSFGFKCRSFPPLLRLTTTTTNDLSPVLVSRRYLSICGKVISGRSSAAPYRSKNEQTSAKLGQSAGPELLTTTGAAIFPGGEKQEGRARC